MMKQTIVVFMIVIATVSAEARDKSQVLNKTKSLNAYNAQIISAAARYGIDPRLLWTIAYMESGFNPKAVSPKGAQGLMQFMPSTARRYGLLNPYDPVSSIDAAARHLRDLAQRFGGRIDLILAAYNAGENAVIKYGWRTPPYLETRNYVARGKLLINALSQRATKLTARLDDSPARHHCARSIYVNSNQTIAPREQRARATRSIYIASGR